MERVIPQVTSVRHPAALERRDRKLPGPQPFGGPRGVSLLGSSTVMQAVRALLAALAQVPWHVRLEGPRGSGKKLAAQLIHALSPRTARRFVSQSLSGLAEGLEFGQLFGWSRGGFTGAVRDTPGLLEEAHDSTLLLDEIAWANRRVQGALLQLLEEQEVLRIGERRKRKVSVRFVFATNADLEAEAAAGRFPRDLLDRMGWLVVRMPALAEHLDDLPELVDGLLRRLGAECGRPVPPITAADLEMLMAYSWPGNVRDLEWALKWYLTFDRWPEVLAGGKPGERARLEQALRASGGNKREAARILGVTPPTLYRLIERTGLRT